MLAAMIRPLILAALLAFPAAAQNINPEPAITHRILVAMPVPVIEGDITDHPYRVLGTVKATVRKAFVFSKNPSDEKLLEALWKNAQEMGADAVLNAKLGPVQDGGPTYARRQAHGQAVRFLSDEEARAWREGRH